MGDGRQDVGEWEPECTHYSNDNTSNPIREVLIDKVIMDHSDLEFIHHTGDIVKAGAEQDEWDRYYEDIDNIVENNISIYYAVGNHEYYCYALGDRVYAPQQDDLATYRQMLKCREMRDSTVMTIKIKFILLLSIQMKI